MSHLSVFFDLYLDDGIIVREREMPAMQSWVVKYTAHMKKVPESLKSIMSTGKCLHMQISLWSLNHPTKQNYHFIYTVFFFLILSKISGWANFSFNSWHLKWKVLWKKKNSVLSSKDSVMAAQRQLPGELGEGRTAGWSPGTSPWGCSRPRTRTCPSQLPGEWLTLFTQDLFRWGFCDLTFQNLFLS